MKKLIFLLFLLLNISILKAQTIKYVELNTGFSTGIVPFFPGGSILVGSTHRFNNGIIFDYEGGVAIPSIVTGKAGVGCNIQSTIVTFGIRPWPSSVYAQIELLRPSKSSDIVLTAEGMIGNVFIQERTESIFTIGWRWKNKPYKEAFKFKGYK